MCGIVGSVSFNDFRLTPNYILRMRDTMEHRGPDGSGVWISEDAKIGLGHRRLAIIDLSPAANQPMISYDRRYYLVFNGEIYNHAELRRLLKERGHSVWQTDHSDSEVILEAFREWGIDCLQHFRGMFAFALWDSVKRELWLVRDRLGVKPLYYTLHHQRLVFASEIKALLQDPDQKRSINKEALYHYLSFLTTPAPMTLFDGVQKLEAGCYLKVTLEGKITSHRYWELWQHTKPRLHSSEDELSQEILSALNESVQLRKVSDVPVGIFLSGGIDSSTNAVLFAKNSKQSINTFSIGYENTYKTYQNELHYARQIADLVHANYHEKILNVDHLLEFLPRMIYLQDEPIADPVCMPIYYLAELAKNAGVTVCQLGEGADELFWGYRNWKIKWMLEKISHFPGADWGKKSAKTLLALLGRDSSLEYAWLERSLANQPIFWGGAEAFTETEKRKLLSPHLNQELKGLSSWQALEPIWKRFKEQAWEPSTLHWMSYLDLNLRLPELLLMRVDKMTMGASLEARVPFLDHRFVELVMSIPEKMKTRHGSLKYLLKKAVQNELPSNILQRKKQGFRVPIYEWMGEKLGDKMQERTRQFLKDQDIFDPVGLQQVLSHASAEKRWYIFNFIEWYYQFIK